MKRERTAWPSGGNRACASLFHVKRVCLRALTAPRASAALSNSQTPGTACLGRFKLGLDFTGSVAIHEGCVRSEERRVGEVRVARGSGEREARKEGRMSGAAKQEAE